MVRFGRAVALWMVWSIGAMSARADVVISNGPNVLVEGGTGTTFTSTSLIRSFGFRVSQSAEFTNVNYMLDEVEIGLEYFAHVEAAVSLWEGAGSPQTFLTPLVTIVPPAGHQVFPYEPLNAVRLEPGRTYWVRVQAGGAGSTVRWDGLSLGAVPSGTFESAGYHSSTGNPGAMRNKVVVRARPVLLSNFDSPASTRGSTLSSQPGLGVRHVGLTTPAGQDWLVTRIRTTVTGQNPAAPRLRVMSGIGPSVVRHTQVGQALNGTINATFNLEPEGELLKGGGRHWFQLSLSNFTGYTWNAASPGAYFGCGIDVSVAGGALSDDSLNRIEVLARPMLGTLPPATLSFAVVGSGETVVTEIVVPPGVRARLHGLVSRAGFVHLVKDFSHEIWTGTDGPELLLASSIDFDIFATAPVTKAVHMMRPMVALEAPNRYWLVSRVTGEHDTTWSMMPEGTRMSGLLRVRRSIVGGQERHLPAIELIGVGFTTCPADLSGSTDPLDEANGVPDGFVDATDFFFFLDAFAQSDEVADMTASADPDDAARYGIKDGVLDSADFFYYLDLFAAGCP